MKPRPAPAQFARAREVIDGLLAELEGVGARRGDPDAWARWFEIVEDRHREMLFRRGFETSMKTGAAPAGTLLVDEFRRWLNGAEIPLSRRASNLRPAILDALRDGDLESLEEAERVQRVGWRRARGEV